ncbi:hypothetical protein FOS14_12645 [Skermania sp. ID1734]|uniref:hypothetical protein n=1 Tax=Skermania sp. ID1734 TaxID=2597516 RepID=UPI00117E15D0|nr:hypothetical protein [Skermania sp. ID1734]TSD99209.1 hypothetical protein FOS14_12645 [Skermania sp. ID1734]
MALRKRPEPEEPSDPARLRVGMRVAVLDNNRWIPGNIVDDFGEGPDPSAFGRDWATTRRWAVALEDGRLLFRNSAELRPTI